MALYCSLKRRWQSVMAGGGADLWSLPRLERVIYGDYQAGDRFFAILIGLYQHHNLAALMEYPWQPEDLITALAIALACRGELNPQNLIWQLMPYLNSPWCEQLKIIDNLVVQVTSRTIARQIIKNDFRFGLFCFLSTPYSWHLAAGDVRIRAIASAYMGYLPPLATADLELVRYLTNYLLAAWSGVYDLGLVDINFYPVVKYPTQISLGA